MRWYKRDPDRALSGMAELTLEERGAYNSLLDLLYSRDGLVPDNDILVARMMSCHWREWRAIKTRLMAKGKVRSEGGMMAANGVQDCLREAASFSQVQRKRAESRWKSTNGTCQDGNANTSTSTKEEIEAKKPLSPRKTRAKTPLPEDWQPSERNRADARKHGWDEARIDHQAQRFRDHARAHGRLQRDWDASWRMWITSPITQEQGNGRSNRQGPNGYRNGQPTIQDVLRAQEQRLARELGIEREGIPSDEGGPGVDGLLSFRRGE